MDCPLHDSLLHVHYKGMLLNEERTVFYDTRADNDGQPLEFSSGEGLVSGHPFTSLICVFVYLFIFMKGGWHHQNFIDKKTSCITT